MTKLTPTLTLTAMTLALAAPLAAQDGDVLPTRGDEIAKYRDAGAWTIRENMTRGNCFASYKSESGAIVQFGFTKSEKVGYLGLFSQLAGDVAPSQDIAVLVNDNLYSGKANGVGASLSDGYKGGYILVNNPDFVKDVELGKELVAFPETPETYVVDMTGASDAVYEVRECTTKLQAKMKSE